MDIVLVIMKLDCLRLLILKYPINRIFWQLSVPTFSQLGFSFYNSGAYWAIVLEHTGPFSIKLG